MPARTSSAAGTKSWIGRPLTVTSAESPLQTTGCYTAQGFLFSRPTHADVAERLLLG